MSGKTTTKSSNTPWAPATGYITDSLSAVKAANDKGQASLDANMGGINSEIARLSGNLAHPAGYQTDARAQLDKTINGDYLNANPHTDVIANLIAQKTGAQYNSTFGSAGRAHGGLSALLSSQGVGDALQSFYNDNYNNERQMQQQAIGMAPGFNADEYTGLNNLLPAAGNAALLPGQVAGNFANSVTNATSPYVQNTTTQKTGGLLPVLSTLGGLAAQIGGAVATGGASAGLSGLVKSGMGQAKSSFLG